MITKEDIRRIKEELKKELEVNGLSKRATFLHATLKRYEKQIKSRRSESSSLKGEKKSDGLQRLY